MSSFDVILLGIQVIIGSASVYSIFNNSIILGLLFMLAVFIIGLLKPEAKAKHCLDA